MKKDKHNNYVAYRRILNLVKLILNIIILILIIVWKLKALIGF